MAEIIKNAIIKCQNMASNKHTCAHNKVYFTDRAKVIQAWANKRNSLRRV